MLSGGYLELSVVFLGYVCVILLSAFVVNCLILSSVVQEVMEKV